MPRLTADALRKRAEWDVDIEDGLTVRVRRLDMVQAYMQDLIPLKLMAALDRMRQSSKKLEEDPTSILAVPQEDKAQTVELLQRYACAAVIDPIFVMEDDGDPDHCPVSMLTSQQLLLIWQSGPKITPKPEVRAEQADTFPEFAEPAETAAVVSDEPEIPPAPVSIPVGHIIAESRYL